MIEWFITTAALTGFCVLCLYLGATLERGGFFDRWHL